MIHNSPFTIVGLGNPGKEYEKTRHNAGRTIVRCFARKHDFPEFVFDKKKNALVAEWEVRGMAVTLLLPETFMNNSGDSLKHLKTNDYGLKTNFVIVHDELDLPVGRIKVSFDRGPAGHKGVASIMRALGTKEFTRVRVGIAPAGEDGIARRPAEPDHFVLQKFSPGEREIMQSVCDKASAALIEIIKTHHE